MLFDFIRIFFFKGGGGWGGGGGETGLFVKCLSLPTAHAANLISDGKVACTGHPRNKVKEDVGDGYATCNSRRVAASSSSPNRQRPKCSSKLIIKTGEHFPQSTGVYVFTLVFFTCWGKKAGLLACSRF